MTTKEVFDANFQLLEDLFKNQPNLINKVQLEQSLIKTEKIWLKNAQRYSGNKIKYLLIGEAPPVTGKYFYDNTKDDLFLKVWRTFFGGPLCYNDNDSYNCLAAKGFLLVDSLPYHVDYSLKQKRNSNYYRAIVAYSLFWWRDLLNKHFTFSDDLRIAFGFYKNAVTIINATGGIISLGGKSRKINRNQIAVDGSYYTSTKELARIFKLNKPGQGICNCGQP